MTPAIFENYKRLVYKESGIVLSDEKQYLLVNRIQKRLRELGITDEAEYLKIIELDVSGNELVRLIDAISTNLTYFYREPQHFEFLRTLLQDWRKERRPEVKVWCAAASSGEEPYTIAIEALENLAKEQKFRLLATDICTEVLQKAMLGVYSDSSVAKIPEPLKKKYFSSIDSDGEVVWRANRELSQTVLFKKFNLVNFPYKLKGNFDIIFCRNVMIYFDNEIRERIVREFFKLLRPGGYLIISLSESLLGVEHGFKKLQGSIFQKVINN